MTYTDALTHAWDHAESAAGKCDQILRQLSYAQQTEIAALRAQLNVAQDELESASDELERLSDLEPVRNLVPLWINL